MPQPYWESFATEVHGKPTLTMYFTAKHKTLESRMR